MTDPASIDPFDPAFIACPFPAYEALREECPVTRVEHGRGFWLVTRYDLVREAVSDPAAFSSEVGSLAVGAKPSPELVARMKQEAPRPGREVPTLLTLDPPGHTRNRRLVSRAFTPVAVRAYEPLARSICRELIGAWRSGVEVDFVRTFAVPLPVRVIAAGLAVPDDRVDDFKRWSDAAVAAIGAQLTEEEMLVSARGTSELWRFVLEQIERKRLDPGTDVVSTLVHARLTDDETADLEGGVARQLSNDEIFSIVRQLLVAGNETTTNLLTQMIVRFADAPEWWDRMRQEPEIIPAVVEECLRLATPSGALQRKTTRDVELGGVTIPAGDQVLLSYLAADHDPAVFADPEAFAPSRPNLAEHMAFGRGIHFCPGASLARLEARIALEELTRAVERFELVTPDDLDWNDSFQLRAIKRLPLVVHPRERPGRP